MLPIMSVTSKEVLELVATHVKEVAPHAET